MIRRASHKGRFPSSTLRLTVFGTSCRSIGVLTQIIIYDRFKGGKIVKIQGCCLTINTYHTFPPLRAEGWIVQATLGLRSLLSHAFESQLSPTCLTFSNPHIFALPPLPPIHAEPLPPVVGILALRDGQYPRFASCRRLYGKSTFSSRRLLPSTFISLLTLVSMVFPYGGTSSSCRKR